jgi:hypothetical protein
MGVESALHTRKDVSVTCTILFELSDPDEVRTTRVRYRVLGITADAFWDARDGMKPFMDDLGLVERRLGTIDAGASRSPTGRTTTWDFCSQEAWDRQAMIDEVLALVRRHFGWTIEPK